MKKNQNLLFLLASTCSLVLLGCQPPSFVVYEANISNCYAPDFQFPEVAGNEESGQITRNDRNSLPNCPSLITYRLRSRGGCYSSVNYVKVSPIKNSCRLLLAVRKHFCGRPPSNVMDEGKDSAELLLRSLAKKNPELKNFDLSTAKRTVIEGVGGVDVDEVVKSWCG